MTFKKNIGTDARVFYTQKGGNDSEEGTSLETAKLTIQGSVDAVNALTVPPNAIDRAAIIVSGSGFFSENITFVNFTSITASGVTNAVATGTNYTLASFSGYSFGLTANSGASEVVFDISNEVSVSLACTEINVTGSSGIAVSVSGTTDDTFCRISQLRLLGDSSIGIDYKATNGEPEVFLLSSITLEDNNTVGYIHNPSSSTARAIFDCANISDIGSPTGTTAIRIIDGHLSAFFNEINTASGLDVQGGILSAIGNCMTADITVAVGATLNVEIAEYSGTITNNGTILGRIGDQQFGFDTVTGPGPTTVINSLAVFDTTQGESIQSLSDIIAVEGSGTSTIEITSGSVTGASDILLSSTTTTGKLVIRYEESTDEGFFNVATDWTFRTLINSDDFIFSLGTNGQLRITSSGANTNAPVSFQSAGANGSISELYLSAVTPQGAITAATAGDLCIFSLEDAPLLYISGTGGATNDDWYFMPTVFDGPDQVLTLRSGSLTGSAGIRLEDDTGGQRALLAYDQSTDISSLRSSTATNLEFYSANGVYSFLNDVGDTAALEVASGSATGSAILRLRDSSGIEQLLILYSENFDSTQFAVSTDLTFINVASNGDFIFQLATGGQVQITSSSASTDSHFSLANTGANAATIEFFTRDTTPQGAITGNPGNVCYVEDGANSDIHLQRGVSASNVDWFPIFGSFAPLTSNYSDWSGPIWDSVTQVAVTAGTWREDTNKFFLALASTTDVVITTTGAGGLQTGSTEAADTWYSVNVIGDSTGVNADNTLLIPDGTAFSQTGYDLIRRVGWVRNDSGSDFIPFSANGKARQIEYQWQVDDNDVGVLFNGSASTFTDVDCSNFIPPDSTMGLFLMGRVTTSSSQLTDFRTNGFTHNGALNRIRPGDVVSSTERWAFDIQTDSNQIIEYQQDTTSGDTFIWVRGFIDNI